MKQRRGSIGAAVVALALLCAAVEVSGADDRAPANFVKTSGTSFTLDGAPFYVAGVNNHYLTFGSRQEVLRVLDDAVAMGANVVRTFLQPVIGSLDGSNPTIWAWRGGSDASSLRVGGTYLLYWDPVTGAMAINGGPDGMEKVDFLLAEIGKRNLKLILAFLDFWDYTGGAQQMRAWYGSTDKSTFFFEDPRTKADYRKWVEHVVGRINSITGLAYRDDPAIMAWELMNEGNAAPESLRLGWSAEMSAYIKSLDPNHLVGSGHAGFLDRMADLAVPGLDFGTWHGYPLYYALSVGQFDRLIGEFCRLGARAGKPVLLEEFGYARSNPNVADAYARWLDTLSRDPDCAGWLVWRLVSLQDSGRYPVDLHDQFDIRNDGSPIWEALRAAAVRKRHAANGVSPTSTGRETP
jgi:mannan endo-1,4-beta-mannosidase